ncbi:hypothetical protein HYT54_01760 [Candidatus Woesearchaeota archaeon]|nr:hypothetical protein [Candidatus Woesearchaeota archaeon]
MSMTDLYATIKSREPVPYLNIKEGQRIAAALPSGEMDIMKIAGLGYSERFGGLIAVASVCPGQASMRLNSDGALQLNALTDLVNPIGEMLIAARKASDWRVGWLINEAAYRKIKEGGTEKALGPLLHYSRAHWINLREFPVSGVTPAEMRQLQQAIEELKPELKEPATRRVTMAIGELQLQDLLGDMGY